MKTRARDVKTLSPYSVSHSRHVQAISSAESEFRMEFALVLEFPKYGHVFFDYQELV